MSNDVVGNTKFKFPSSRDMTLTVYMVQAEIHGALGQTRASLSVRSVKIKMSSPVGQ